MYRLCRLCVGASGISGESFTCVLSSLDLADWLPACGGCHTSRGGLFPGQLAGVGDQQGSRDMREESGERKPGS